MRLVLDSNIVISAIVGRTDPIAVLVAEGAELLIPEAQAFEVLKVLQRHFGFDRSGADTAVGQILSRVRMIESTALQPSEDIARRRLDARGQPDWPVLAAAIELDADIWSHDRDFFGVGVPVWKTRNILAAVGMA
ncbi:hypothetical protein ASG11_16790 [Sphingomonas sp. Leaf357]|uniref:PIN domain-containing protein n=1 Tax=Sphingomonas sp. Leaf357 TaxID=1736350 RepID=UPI0006F836F2|nr:PIN domain-containing protein [Sphingomonas sp. Leaf357]KQS01342.1 hypothetical protein ASG11_16790 [Sphingomonas sp. Leaf357]